MIVPVHANPWTAIVGRGRQGRNTMIYDVAHRLRAEGLVVGGFTHVGVPGRLGPGFDAHQLFGPGVAPVARSSMDPQLCHFGFDDGAIGDVGRWCAAPSDVVFIEMGRLESHGRGYWPAVHAAFTGPPRLLVLSIRPHVLSDIAQELPDPAGYVELPYAQASADRFARELLTIHARLAIPRR